MSLAQPGKRGNTKFGFIEGCGLAKAKAEKRRYAPEDHRHQCNHVACDACGEDLRRRFLRLHRIKGEVILDETVDVLLTWEPMSMHSGSIPSTLKFFDATRKLGNSLKQGHLLDVDGFLVANQCNRVSPTSSKFQWHLHASFLPRKMSKDEIIAALKEKWCSLGGADVGPRKRKKNAKKPCLAGLIAYLWKHHPLQRFSDAARLRMHRNVLNVAERKMGASAARHFIGGRALSAQGFRKMRSRAAFELRHGKPTTIQKKLAARRDADYENRNYCPTVRHLCPGRKCPYCKAHGKRIKKNGRTEIGTQRFLCKKCRKSFLGESVNARVKAASKAGREHRRIERFYASLGSQKKVAKRLGITLYAVRKALGKA